ncbi:protein kinase [Streptomyces agglomeratus]|uniref:serine/threonine-protein kinase n=1 Tax=Streptomyces agglomeratus TaxID=285458 RepID=UPI0008691DE1|nr:serine/threonine-protein kinase [Streptomyces agglomeratus]OEJ58199.1 protein kinase [Streptomyces agglomeratus]
MPHRRGQGSPVSTHPGSSAQRVIAGRYRLLAPLGEGGMGVVWRARDEVLGREVAVKEVRAPSGLGATDGRRLYARLEREAWAAARISHPNVITVYDVATEDGRPWIVMELVRGLSLSDVLDSEGPMTPQRAARIGAEVLAALRAAHGAGVLHRDVKPANVLIANDGRVVLTDFGIATVEGTSALTMTGELIGSPEFLAPERAMGRTPGPESDLWSLGVLLYAAVEGHSPFRQDTPLSTLRAVVDEELPRPVRAGALAPVVEGLLRKEPAERMSAAEAERLLRTVGAGGAPHTATGPAGPYGPPVTGSTAVGGSSPHGGPVPLPVPSPLPAATTTATDSATPPGASRRGLAVLVAGVAALLLAAGGITWALLNADDDPDTTTGGVTTGGTDNGGTGGGGTGGPTGGDTGSGGGSGGPGGSTANGGNGNGGGGGTATPPHHSVEVTVTALTGGYSGACPPPEAEAPSFTATFTVGRVPVEVGYRWVTSSGESSASGWKTLSFGAGEGKSKRVNHTETAYEEGGTRRDEIRVEVRSPVRATSGSVPFSVTCEQETPTDGASHPAGGPADGRGSGG